MKWTLVILLIIGMLRFAFATHVQKVQDGEINVRYAGIISDGTQYGSTSTKLSHWEMIFW